MIRTDIKEIFIKTLIFINSFLAILPWVYELFSWSFEPLWIIKLFSVWALLGLLAVTIGIVESKGLLKAKKAIIRALIITIPGVMGAFLVSYLMTSGVQDFIIMFILLSLITMLLWAIAVYIAGVFPYTKLLNIKALSIGLLLLSLYSVLFRLDTAVIVSWTCFVLYLILSSLLFIFSSSKNVKMVSFGVVLIILVSFIIGAARRWLFKIILWIYINIVVKLLLLFINILAFFSKGLFTAASEKSSGDSGGGNNLTETLDNIRNMPQSLNQDFSPFIKNSAAIFIIILVCLLTFFIIRAAISRLYFKRKEEKKDIEEKEFVLPDINLSGFTKGTSRLITRIRRRIYGASLEQRIRKMMRDIFLLAVRKKCCIKSSTTPNEARDILETKEDKLFEAYNDVRYGEKNLSQQEYSDAERSYQSLKGELSSKK